MAKPPKTRIAQENERLRRICENKDQTIAWQHDEITRLRSELGRVASALRVLKKVAESYSADGEEAI
jgi:hypothetical protein